VKETHHSRRRLRKRRSYRGGELKGLGRGKRSEKARKEGFITTRRVGKLRAVERRAPGRPRRRGTRPGKKIRKKKTGKKMNVLQEGKKGKWKGLFRSSGSAERKGKIAGAAVSARCFGDRKEKRNATDTELTRKKKMRTGNVMVKQRARESAKKENTFGGPRA